MAKKVKYLKQGNEFDALLEEYREKQKKPLKIPYRKMRDKFDIDRRIIDGVTCYVVRQKGTTPDKAVLYLFGGGYILPPDPGDIVLCGQNQIFRHFIRRRTGTVTLHVYPS